MKNLIVLPLAICFLAVVVSDANAQYGHYNGYGGGGYGSGGYGGGYYGNQTDPRMGYCLKNDCAGGGGYGGGCGGSGYVYIKITTGGPAGTAPTVQSYYPQLQPGCGGIYGNNTQETRSRPQDTTSRYRSPQRRAEPARPNVTQASYRYKF